MRQLELLSPRGLVRPSLTALPAPEGRAGWTEGMRGDVNAVLLSLLGREPKRAGEQCKCAWLLAGNERNALASKQQG